ncbi:O-antigen ligase family protein [Pseudomonas mucidolens]|uniref:O-antigen ligase family protein n=1 Tax=Pseudomonas mucidolens TaxID=46679 RepID=UPI0030DC5BE8
MTLSAQHRGRVFLTVALALLMLCITPSFSGHDWQRSVQIGVGLCALLYGLSGGAVRCGQRLVDRPTASGLVIMLGLGLVSSGLAHQPLWALTEWALLITCGAIAAAFAMARRNGDETLDRMLMLFVLLLCLIKSLQYGHAVVLTFTGGASTLDMDRLLSGFSNKRFYGQFQTFTLPLLALPLLLPTTSRGVRGWVFALLCTWWLIAISGGTRGTWLGMGAAAMVLVFLGAWGRRWVAWQMAALGGGLLFYWLLFNVLAQQLGMQVFNVAQERLTASLSGREVIWWQAWEMIRERPLLGFGPMHFADIANPVATHPHQAILQWASEWGLPSTLCVMILALRGLWATLRVLRQRAQTQAPADRMRLCLFAALIGALSQSMVDGVIVMPNSQLWLALVVGWLMALHPQRTPASGAIPLLHRAWRVLTVLAVAGLIGVGCRDLPHTTERNQHYIDHAQTHLQPRFWAQGVIAPEAR